MSATATKPRSSRNGSAPPAELFEIPIERIILGDNVRADVGDVDDLAASIQLHGILQPLRVEPGGDSLYILKIGHRRLAAAKQLGLAHVPAIVDSTPALGPARSIQQLVENIQRRDLNPLEEAKALRGILDASKGMTQDQLAAQVGRSRPAVTNLLRILDLDPKVMARVERGELTAAHAKALAGLKGQAQRDYAEYAVQSKWSAHHLEERVQGYHDAEAREAKALEDLAGWAEKAEAALVEKGADRKTSKLTTWDDWSGGERPTDKALKARGWKYVGRSYSRGKACDCSAFAVTAGWNGGEINIRRRCISADHAKLLNQEKASAGARRAEREAAKAKAAREERDRIAAPVAALLHQTSGSGGVAATRILLYTLATSHWRVASNISSRVDGRVDAYSAGPTWDTIAALPENELAGLLAAVVAETALDSSPSKVIQAIADLAGVKPAETEPPADEDIVVPDLSEGLEWRRARKTPNGGWLPAAHAFAKNAPTGNSGGSVPAVAVCGLATGHVADSRIPVERTIDCDTVVPVTDPKATHLKAAPACTKCAKGTTA